MATFYQTENVTGPKVRNFQDVRSIVRDRVADNSTSAVAILEQSLLFQRNSNAYRNSKG